MKIVIPGTPFAKARPRFGKNGVAFDAQYKEKNFVKLLLKNAITMALNGKNLEDAAEAIAISNADALAIDMTFYLPINETDSESEKNLKLWGINCANKKPDLDNLEKFIFDAANSIVFEDDRVIIKSSARKLYSTNPRTELNIMSLSKAKKNLSECNKAVFKHYSPTEFKEFLADVRTLSIVYPEYFEDLSEQVQDEWLMTASNLVKNFSKKHAIKLKKIQVAANQIGADYSCDPEDCGENIIINEKKFTSYGNG